VNPHLIYFFSSAFCGKIEIHPQNVRVSMATYGNGKIVNHFQFNGNYSFLGGAMREVERSRYV